MLFRCFMIFRTSKELEIIPLAEEVYAPKWFRILYGRVSIRRIDRWYMGGKFYVAGRERG